MESLSSEKLGGLLGESIHRSFGEAIPSLTSRADACYELELHALAFMYF